MTLTVTSLNLNGIRAAARKGLETWLEQRQPDFLCVQELKAQHADMEKAGLLELAGMASYSSYAEKKGYSGVAIYTKHQPTRVIDALGVQEFDDEGRYVELRFDTPQSKLSVISCYFPSGTSGSPRQDAKYRFLDAIYNHLGAMQAEREILLCGDVNIAHNEIDLKNWRGNRKNSGFLPEERAWMDRLLNSDELPCLADVFRQLEPTAEGAAYTWWSNRGQAYANNTGWRIDYHLATAAIADTALRWEVYKDERFSDHAPLTVEYAAQLPVSA